MRAREILHVLHASLLFSPILGACVFSYPERRLDAFTANIMHPSSGAVIGLGETIIEGYSYHPGRELSRLVFYANGRIIGEDPATEDYTGADAIGLAVWSPPGVGEYLL